jgi:hypothetical protein
VSCERSHRRHRDRSERGLARWFRAASHREVRRWWKREQRKFYGRLPRLIPILEISARLRYAAARQKMRIGVG